MGTEGFGIGTERELTGSTRGATERRGGGGGTGFNAGIAELAPRTGGGGAEGVAATGRDGGGGGAAAERRKGGGALGPVLPARRGGVGLPGLGLSSGMSGSPYATNARRPRKAL
jgi:hypothetical protein